MQYTIVKLYGAIGYRSFLLSPISYAGWSDITSWLTLYLHSTRYRTSGSTGQGSLSCKLPRHVSLAEPKNDAQKASNRNNLRICILTNRAMIGALGGYIHQQRLLFAYRTQIRRFDPRSLSILHFGFAPVISIESPALFLGKLMNSDRLGARESVSNLKSVHSFYSFARSCQA
jgi:hypothetical protein